MQNTFPVVQKHLHFEKFDNNSHMWFSRLLDHLFQECFRIFPANVRSNLRKTYQTINTLGNVQFTNQVNKSVLDHVNKLVLSAV